MEVVTTSYANKNGNIVSVEMDDICPLGEIIPEKRKKVQMLLTLKKNAKELIFYFY